MASERDPNPFTRVTEADGSWMARFDGARVAAAVSIGQYDADSADCLTRTWIGRRDAILARYLTGPSPLTVLEVRGSRRCGVDLARHTRMAVAPAAPSARLEQGDQTLQQPRSAVPSGPEGERCVLLSDRPAPANALDNPRYLVLEVTTGSAIQPLRAHLYDLGAGGLRRVGIERE